MSQLVWYSVVSTHHTMTTDLGIGWKRTLLKKKYIFEFKEKSTAHHMISSAGEGKQKHCKCWLWELRLSSTDNQCSAEREGRYLARHLHLNTMGPSRPRNPCPCHSYCHMWCSFWCGGTFTYIKLTADRMCSIEHRRPFCVCLSQQQMHFSDRWVCTEPKDI